MIIDRRCVEDCWSRFVTSLRQNKIVMKKATKFLAAIAVTIGAYFAHAEESAFKVNVVGEKKFHVEIAGIQGSTVSYIKDDQGQILYKKNWEKDNISLLFDLSFLKAGSYSLVIKDDVKIQTLPFEVSNEGVEVTDDRLVRTYFPKIEQLGDELLVSLLSNESNDLTVRIESFQGELLREDKMDGELGLIGKRYVLTPGDYAISMVSDNFAKTSYLKIRK